MTIKIVLVDDHHVVRRGLALLLNSQEDFEVVAEATNGAEAVQQAKELSPDIVLMDLVMPVLNGIEATKQIIENNPKQKILILTSFSDQDYAIPALEAGANGYLLKESNPDDVIIGIRKIINGEKTIHSKVTDELLSALHTQKNNVSQLHHSLTKREKEVLKEITNGKSNKEIASSLFITEKTVKTHVSNILAKLNVQDRTQAALYAIREKID